MLACAWPSRAGGAAPCAQLAGSAGPCGRSRTALAPPAWRGLTPAGGDSAGERGRRLGVVPRERRMFLLLSGDVTPVCAGSSPAALYTRCGATPNPDPALQGAVA